MPDEETKVTFGELDFDTIEAAVMETARGRWFLNEYARRNRNADTQAVLDAIERLKGPAPDARAVAPLKTHLESMAAAIRQTKEEIRSFAALNGGDPASALSEAELQAAAEQRIRRMVWTIQHLESQIGDLLALCKPEPGQPEPGAGPFEGEKAQHLHPHPAFLM